jgi:hypothetical protein
MKKKPQKKASSVVKTFPTKTAQPTKPAMQPAQQQGAMPQGRPDTPLAATPQPQMTM